MRFILTILFLSSILIKAQAQNFSKDTLYLKIDTLQVEQSSTIWQQLGTKQARSFMYWYFPLQGGSNLEFHCADRTLVQVVQQSTLSNYTVRTLEQLKAYINTLTYQQALTYLEKMKRYYIVEILPNGTAEIIPVKLDMQID